MFDAQLIQTIGALATPAAAGATFLYGFIRRKKIASIFAPKAALIVERDLAIAERDRAKREAASAEAANRNQSDSIEALKVSLGALQSQVGDLQSQIEKNNVKVLPLQEKVDALVDWATLMISHFEYLDRILRGAGIRPDKHMPPVPPILADRFNVPETLR